MTKPFMYPTIHYFNGRRMISEQDFDNAKDYIEYLEKQLEEAKRLANKHTNSAPSS